MYKIVPAIAVAAIFLTSCVGIDSHLTIRDNGAGTLALTYRVSQLVANLGDSTDGHKVVPLPLERADFERSLEGARGKVRLVSFDRSENDKDVIIRAELAFDSLDALAAVDAFRGAEIKASAAGGTHTFSQLIARAPQQPVSQDSLRMIDAFFNGYDLSFVVDAPQPITSNSLGTLSDNHRTLSYKTTILDIVRVKSNLVLSMSW